MTQKEFDELRPSAFAITYRMLGSVSEAEDVVHEGFLRLHLARAGDTRIESPRAYLSTVVSRLSLLDTSARRPELDRDDSGRTCARRCS
jgi:DNA-directed RNA polymerase specialized sigma24 family protein